MEFLKRPNERLLIAMVKPMQASAVIVAERLGPRLPFNSSKCNNLRSQFISWTTGICFFFLLLASVYIQLYKPHKPLL